MGFLDFGVDVWRVNSHHVGEVTPYVFACSFVAVTMFWKFDLNTTSHVDKLLDREDVTLRELMDEDDILQECKAQNQKLLGFLCRQQCMEELVSLITQDPPLDMEEKVRFKYVLRLGPGPRAGRGCGEGVGGVGGWPEPRLLTEKPTLFFYLFF